MKEPVVCAWCGARLNEWCVSSKGWQREDHLPRRLKMWYHRFFGISFD